MIRKFSKRSMTLLLTLIILIVMGLFSFFTRTVHTQIDINAPADVVRKVLFTFGEYKNWNPYIAEITGDANMGGKIKITVLRPGKDPMTFNCKVTEFSDERLRWTGGLLAPVIFGVAQEFELRDIGKGRTLLLHNEDLRGFGTLFVDTKEIKAQFESMNKALKEKAESTPE